MSISLEEFRFGVLPMRTRMPFRYGVTTLTALPYLFAEARCLVDGRSQVALAADGLAPKWFTKDPHTSIEQDQADMLEVIHHAFTSAQQAGRCASVFELWQATYAGQQRWAAERGHAPLLASFGSSLVERAAIDAWCKARAEPFADAVRRNSLGLDLGAMHASLRGAAPAELLPARPRDRVAVRHTVGLADPLTDDEIPAADRLDDGLPQSLAACLKQYGLRYLKIKIGGDAEADLDRLRRIARLLEGGGHDVAFTLDGNEQYRDVDSFRAFWQSLRDDAALAPLMQRMIAVEQPLHRDVALSPETARALAAWEDRPATIIDESDGELDSLPRAIEAGYVGTSHKNCKGVFKGVANACLIASLHRREPAGPWMLTGEDLCNVGPVALLQDLAVVASLGLGHVERNGHHYMRGLSMYDDNVQRQVLDAHGDLYHRHADGYPALHVRDGMIELTSVLAAPFGTGVAIDVGKLEPVPA